MLDPQVVARHIVDIGVGAHLRGIEATVVGTLERRDGKPVLRIARTDQRLSLALLEQKVQWHPDRKRPLPSTPDERRALKRLLADWNGEPRRVVITGPLVRGKGGVLALQVRAFEPPSSR